jgi:MFS superfamily sulfate permease-like transporter
MERNNGSAAVHGDPGLQPERTTLAWGRTMFALVTASAIFLRWLPQHGLPILLLFAVAAAAAAAIYFTQRRRYSASTQGIVKENVNADIPAVFWTAFTGVVLGGLGITVVLFAA